jgi:hypothetical protein
MTAKEKMERKGKESWYRVQLSILEDIIYDYECGEKDYDETIKVFTRNIKYVLFKNINGFLPNDLYELYEDEAQSAYNYIIELNKIRENL